MRHTKRLAEEPDTTRAVRTFGEIGGSPSKVIRQEDDAYPSTSVETSSSAFHCHICNAAFARADALKRHRETQHGDQSLTCKTCHKNFSRKDKLIVHMKTCSSRLQPENMTCTVCHKVFSRGSSLVRHRKTHTSQTCAKCGETFPSGVSLSLHLKSHNSVLLATAGDPLSVVDPRNPTSATCPPSECKTALKGVYERHRVYGSALDVDLTAFLRSQPHGKLLRDAVQRMKGVKFFVSANVLMVRPKGWVTTGAEETMPYFTSMCGRSFMGTNNGELLKAAYEKVENDVSQYLREGSGWVVGHVNFVDLVISVYRPYKGSSYLKLPPKIERTRGAVVNVENEDDKCFLWAVLSALRPIRRNPERLSHYKPYEHSLNTVGITFPMSLDDIPKFAEQNNIRINLFGYRDGEVFPIYISEQSASVINLLLIFEGTNRHYVWIKDFNLFMSLVTRPDVPDDSGCDDIGFYIDDVEIDLSWC